MKSKILMISLASIIGFSSIFSGVGNIPVYGSVSSIIETKDSYQHDNTYFEEIESSAFWTTALIKTAIRGIIASKSKVISAVRTYGSPAAATAIDRNFSSVTRELEKLLSQSSLVTQSVADAISRGLYAATGSKSVATSAANAVKTVLDWFI